VTTSPVIFTAAGLRRGFIACLPMLVAMAPFGLICGVLSQGVGLSLAETMLMAMVVFAGSAQLVSLGIWSHPPDLLAVTLATFVINLRMALMGPVLSPWLDQLRGWRVWGSLFFMADQNWAMSVGEMNKGGRDAAYLLGSGLAFWSMWVSTSALGFVLGAAISPAPGHPLFFAALAVFVVMLAQMWRGKVDVLPWLIAAVVSTAVAWLLPGTFWFIVAGALTGSVIAGVRDQRRA
jgi:4-azaleucine resistance transporter AzlC